ncbi:hypothetical protein GGI15_000571 [Coemansia interrupta]|uniref:Uncharacterized protein n=1 Tax=Coemansia interrupta TaxID=1126814 RepID=A0A9W8HLQ2_9FUNG|nr:hypothetical protein GGI15_000571 [Coemansia interrupta]
MSVPLTISTASQTKPSMASACSLLTPPESPKLQTKAQQSLQSSHRPGRIFVGDHECVTEPVPWTMFKQYIDAKTLDPLGRSPATQTAYEAHKQRVKSEFGTMAEYLTKHSLRDFLAQPTDPEVLAAGDFTFRRNDFPYSIGDGVEHWVLWCRKRLQPGFVAPDEAVRAIEERFGTEVEWRYFVNPVAKQSVPQLSHAHVFVHR